MCDDEWGVEEIRSMVSAFLSSPPATTIPGDCGT